MPVEKFDPRLRHATRGFTTIPNATIQAIKCATALGILLYLASKPQNWTVRKADIKKQLGIGEDRYNKAAKVLRDLGLWTDATVRNDRGQIEGRVIWISTEIPENHDLGLTEIPENRDHGKPVIRENRVHTNKRVIKNNKTLKNTPAVADGFDEFYKNYPKKVKKPEAERAWKKLKPEEREKALADDLNLRYGSRQKVHIPNPATHLNGHMWNDEIIQPEKKGAVQHEAPKTRTVRPEDWMPDFS